MNKRQLKALGKVLNYLWECENIDFETAKSEGIEKDHIFNELIVLNTYHINKGGMS